MSIHSFESSSREQRRSYLRTSKRNLIFSITKRIEEQLDENPEVDSFTVPLIMEQGVRSNYLRTLLRDFPETVTRSVQPRIGREVLLRLDESIEPPLLAIELPTPS